MKAELFKLNTFSNPIAMSYTRRTINSRKKRRQILIKYIFGKSIIVLGASKK